MTVKFGLLGLVLALSSLPVALMPDPAAAQPRRIAAKLELAPCRVPDVDEELRCGTYHVPENRASPNGKMLPIKIVLLPARTPSPAKEPIFWVSGGPGETATSLVSYFADNWRRRTHDVVLIDQRGTGEGHRLYCKLPGSDADLQPYLDVVFQTDAIRACRKELEAEFDLAQYTTPIAVEDYDEIRRALGYDRIHIHGSSYGTRFSLAYIKKYGRHVRTALLYSLVPFENRVPLYFAAGAQAAFDTLIADCAADARCRAAYPDPKGDLERTAQRLREQPARVTIPHPTTGVPTDVTLSEEAFRDTIRGLMFWSPATHAVPMLLRQAASGDYVRLVRNGILRGQGFRELNMGMNLSVMCGEDGVRIRGDEVEAQTAGRFAGAASVKGQWGACAEWPKGTMPSDYFRPFRSKVPTILVSGRYDPPTGPRWGEVAKGYFTDSVHLVVPGAHTPDSDCIGEVAGQLLRTGSLRDLDTSCISKLQPPPFRMPGE